MQFLEQKIDIFKIISETGCDELFGAFNPFVGILSYKISINVNRVILLPIDTLYTLRYRVLVEYITKFSMLLSNQIKLLFLLVLWCWAKTLFVKIHLKSNNNWLEFCKVYSKTT